MSERLKEVGLDDYARECVDLEPLALEEEFVRLPADLAYWATRFSTVAREYQLSKFHREQTAARLHSECRETLMEAAIDAASQGGAKAKVKSPTVDDIKAAVATHEDLVGARELEAEKEEEKWRIFGVVDAIRCKRDMLIQIGAQRRAEMQQDPSIRKDAMAKREDRDNPFD